MNQVEIYINEFVANGSINVVEASTVCHRSARFYGATEISRPRMQVLRPDALVPHRNVTMQIS